MNETIWSVKRKDGPGQFILRSTEQAGKILKVSIALVNEEHSTTFDLNPDEFENFLGILSNFKDLIESPEHLTAHDGETESSTVYPASSYKSEISIGETKGKTLQRDEFEDALANLEALTRSMQSERSSTSKTATFSSSNKKVEPPIYSVEKAKTEPTKTTKTTKSTLKETDWDPW